MGYFVVQLLNSRENCKQIALSEVSSYIGWIQIVFTAIDYNGSLLICPLKIVRIFNISMFWVSIMTMLLAINLNHNFL